MVIGNDDLDTARSGRRHASHAGHAVVDGDDQLRCRLHRFDQRRTEPVAVDETMRHCITHPLRTQQPQPTHGNGSTSGAIAVVVTGNHDGPVVTNRLEQNLDRLRHAAQCLWRQHARQSMLHLIRCQHATRRINLLQYGVH